jgi:hypothetical protein
VVLLTPLQAEYNIHVSSKDLQACAVLPDLSTIFLIEIISSYTYELVARYTLFY